MKKIILNVAIALCMLLAFVFTGCSNNGAQSTTPPVVRGIEIVSMPTDTEYSVGESFSTEGLTIKVKYSDGTYSDAIELNDLTISAPDMTSAKQQNVLLKYVVDNIEYYASFDITVSDTAHEHAYGEWSTITVSTCTTAGIEKRICSVCSKEDFRTVEALGHSFGEWSTVAAPTCTTEGSAKRVCSVCNTEESQRTEAIGHDYELKTVVPTCQNEGYNKHTCKICNDVYYDSNSSALEHIFSGDMCVICGEQVTKGLLFDLNEDCISYAVEGYEGSSKKVVIPSTYKGLPVTIIDYGCFSFSDIVSVVIPSSIEQIMSKAFYFCNSLEEIIISENNNLNYVSNFAVSNKQDDNLDDEFFTFGGFLLGLNEEAESETENIVIPEGIIGITQNVFADNTTIKSVSFPSSLKYIDYGAFNNATALSDIDFGEAQLEYIADFAFNNTAWFESQPDGVVYIQNIAYAYKGDNETSTGKLVIREGTESISSYAFNETLFSEVEIPSSVKIINSGAFGNCSNLTNVTFADNSELETISYYAFWGTAIEDFVIPSSVKRIYSEVFEVIDKSKLNVTLSSNEYYRIADDCLIYNLGDVLVESLSEATVIPDCVKAIGEYVFVGEFERVIVPDGVQKIASNAFYNVTDRESTVVFEGSIDYLSKEAFYGHSLKVYFYENTPSAKWSARWITTDGSEMSEFFFGGAAETKNWLSDGNEHWHMVDGEKTDVAQHSFYNAYCEVCAYAYSFEGTEGLVFDITSNGDSYVVIDYTGTSTTVVIPDYYKGLPISGIYELYQFSDLTSVTLGKYVEQIESYAFADTNLNELIAPEGCAIKYISSSAFYNTPLFQDAEGACIVGDLLLFYRPEKTEKIGKEIYIHVPDGVKYISEYAFSNICRESKSSSQLDFYFYLPASVESIERGAFNNIFVADIFVAHDNLHFYSTNDALYERTLEGDWLVRMFTDSNDFYFRERYDDYYYDDFSVSEGTIGIYSYAFDNTLFTDLYIPLSVLYVEPYIFTSNTNLYLLDDAYVIIDASYNDLNFWDKDWDELFGMEYATPYVYYNFIYDYAHLHNYINPVKATCTTEGASSYYYCKECGLKYKYYECVEYFYDDNELIIPASGHNIVAVAESPATCIKNGNTAHFKCSNCNLLYLDANGETVITPESVVIKMTPHTTEYHAKVNAACKQTGTNEYWLCSVCNKYFADAECTQQTTLALLEIPALEHNASAITATLATCTQNGNIGYWFCDNCGKYYSNSTCTTEITLEQTITNKLPHTAVYHSANTATCTVSGNIEYWQCSVCNGYFDSVNCSNEISYEDTVTDANGHNFSTVDAVTPTCTTTGNIAYRHCSVCDKNFATDSLTELSATDIELPLIAHVLTRTPALAVTCTVAGNTAYYTCSVCDRYFSDESAENQIELSATVIAAGHTPSETISFNDDSHYYVCTVCDEHLNIAAHTYDAGVVTLEPTFTESGERKYTCTFCGRYYVETLAMKTHNLVRTARIEATCTENGNVEYWHCTDTDCGKFYSDAYATTEITTTVIPAHHTLTTTEAKESTCLAQGNIAYRHCSVCDKNFATDSLTELSATDIVLPIVTHNAVAHARVEPTCTVNGNSAFWQCSVCNKYFTNADCTTETTLSNTIITASHDVASVWSSDDDYHYHACNNCDERFDETAHTFGVGIITTEPTDSADGVKSFTCTICDKSKTEVIPAYSPNLNFILTSGNTYSVRANTNYDSASLVIPEIYNGKPVTRIENLGFRNFTCITSVSLPETVTEISNSSFDGCSSLASIILPSSCKIIGNSAFMNCALTVIDLSMIEKVCKQAFYGCESLAEVTFSTALKSLGESYDGAGGGSAFVRCSALKRINIPSIEHWLGITICEGGSPFDDSHGNFYIDGVKLEKLVIPSNIKNIKDSSFGGIAITELTISEGVETIGKDAFSGCTSLTTVTIPSTMLSIGNSAFSLCSAISRVNISDVNDWCKIDFGNTTSNPFAISSSCNLFVDGVAITEINLTTTKVSKFAFCSAYYQKYNSNITSVTINVPSGNTCIIGNKAFYQLQITSLTLGEGITEIESSAFSGNSVASLKIPSTLTTVGEGAFTVSTTLTKTVIIDSEPVSSALSTLYNSGSLLVTLSAEGKGVQATTVFVKKGLAVGSYLTNTANYSLDSTSNANYDIYNSVK